MFITRLLIFGSAFVFMANAFHKHSELLSVIQIFRHGQRVPLAFYPNDPYADSRFWDASPGQLTKQGKFQAYDLGVYTRKRYMNFLPSDYSEKDFYAYTTDFDRTHMSAQAFIAGLYPPTEKDVWHRYLNWNPIPVHPAPEPLLMFRDCPVFFDTAASITKKLYKDFLLENKDVLEYVSLHSGVDTTNLTATGYLSDTLFIENDVGYPLPEWTQIGYTQPLKGALIFLIGMRGFTESLKRLGNGPFLNKVVEKFEEKLQNSTGHKLTAYSGHDHNLIGLLNTFGYDFKPKFSSSIYFELWKHGDIPYINVYFKNGNMVYPLQVKECDFNCQLDDFKYTLREYIINEKTFKEECFANSDRKIWEFNENKKNA